MSRSRRFVADILRWGLVLVLIAAAVTKIFALGNGFYARWGFSSAPYLAGVTIELALAGLLVSRKTCRFAASLAALGFLGAAGATLLSVIVDGAGLPCGCLGELTLTRGTALTLQGIIVSIAGLVTMWTVPVGEADLARSSVLD